MAASLDLTTVGLDSKQYSPLNMRTIRQSLSDAETALERIKNEKEEYRRLLEKAKEEEKQLVRNISRYKIALAPHRLLPDDILRRTFNILAHGPVCFPLSRKVNYPPP